MMKMMMMMEMKMEMGPMAMAVPVAAYYSSELESLDMNQPWSHQQIAAATKRIK